MIPWQSLPAYILAVAALSLAPGPDNLYVVSQGVAYGRRVALFTAWGMCSGLLVHTSAAAVGLSALFYSSALLFRAVQWAGAGYLLWLAVVTVMRRGGFHEPPAAPARAAASWRRGFLMNLLNPKVGIFFLAFLPQFTVPALGRLWLQMLLLGGIFFAVAILIFSLIALTAGSLGSGPLRRWQQAPALRLLCGGIYAALGLRLLLTHR